jgi:hypothetical protein
MTTRRREYFPKIILSEADFDAKIDEIEEEVKFFKGAPKPPRSCQKSTTYANQMKNQCANPECEYGFDVEGHHIVPKSKDGEDEYYNLVALCGKCHRKRGLHSRFEDYTEELFVWKSLQEQEIYGLGCFDECFDGDIRDFGEFDEPNPASNN